MFLDALSDKANMALLSIANDIVVVSERDDLSNDRELGNSCSI